MEQRDELLTIKQLAELLQVPVATIYRWRHFGEGPCGIRVSGRHVRYRRSDVEAFLQSGPISETASKLKEICHGARAEAGPQRQGPLARGCRFPGAASAAGRSIDDAMLSDG